MSSPYEKVVYTFLLLAYIFSVNYVHASIIDSLLPAIRILDKKSRLFVPILQRISF